MDSADSELERKLKQKPQNEREAQKAESKDWLDKVLAFIADIRSFLEGMFRELGKLVVGVLGAIVIFLLLMKFIRWLLD